MCMMLFQTRPFWIEFRVPLSLVREKFLFYFGKEEIEIKDLEKAHSIIFKALTTSQEYILKRIKDHGALDSLLKISYIFGEVQSYYFSEKGARKKLVKNNISPKGLVDTFEENKDIMRCILDASNIWIENCILYQSEDDQIISEKTVRESFVIDMDLLIDLYVCGMCSQAVSFLTLSKNNNGLTFEGVRITPHSNTPFILDYYHPVIYFNTAIVGNQDILEKQPLNDKANQTPFGIGFAKTYGVDFLLFLATIYGFQVNELKGNDRAIRIIGKKQFEWLVEHSTNLPINGDIFYNSFVLTQRKIQSQLREGEPIVWKQGVNKERIEIKPFIALGDNVILSYALLEQAKQLWASYFSNGGSCYSGNEDYLLRAMNKRNQELSDILVVRIREELNKRFHPKVDSYDVKYDRIFGERNINYGDFDVVFYTEDTNELFLVEAKYFSDSLNASAVVTDYNKLFEKEGYYDHCRRRYDLVLDEPEKVKAFIGTEDEIKMHLLFISSKPLELNIQDEDGVVTFLSLNVFGEYLDGKLIGENDEVVRPTQTI